MNPQNRADDVRTSAPEMEKTMLTPREEELFLSMVEDLMSKTKEETDEFLEGHRTEEQGE